MGPAIGIDPGGNGDVAIKSDVAHHHRIVHAVEARRAPQMPVHRSHGTAGAITSAVIIVTGDISKGQEVVLISDVIKRQMEHLSRRGRIVVEGRTRQNRCEGNLRLSHAGRPCLRKRADFVEREGAIKECNLVQSAQERVEGSTAEIATITAQPDFGARVDGVEVGGGCARTARYAIEVTHERIAGADDSEMVPGAEAGSTAIRYDETTAAINHQVGAHGPARRQEDVENVGADIVFPRQQIATDGVFLSEPEAKSEGTISEIKVR